MLIVPEPACANSPRIRFSILLITFSSGISCDLIPGLYSLSFLSKPENYDDQDLKMYKKTRKNAIVKYLDYQIPVTQLKGNGAFEMKICKQQNEIKMRHLPAVDRLKRNGR